MYGRAGACGAQRVARSGGVRVRVGRETFGEREREREERDMQILHK